MVKQRCPCFLLRQSQMPLPLRVHLQPLARTLCVHVQRLTCTLMCTCTTSHTYTYVYMYMQRLTRTLTCSCTNSYTETYVYMYNSYVYTYMRTCTTSYTYTYVFMHNVLYVNLRIHLQPLTRTVCVHVSRVQQYSCYFNEHSTVVIVSDFNFNIWHGYLHINI